MPSTSQIEDELRAAYAGMPPPRLNTTALVAAARLERTRLRRRRTGLGIGLAAAVGAAEVTALVATAISGQPRAQTEPAGVVSTHRAHSARPTPRSTTVARTPVSTSTTARNLEHGPMVPPLASRENQPPSGSDRGINDDYEPPNPSPSLGTDRRVHAMAGYLLPHGSQLPQDLSYEGSGKYSVMDGYGSNSVPAIYTTVSGGSLGKFGQDRFPVVASARDLAINITPDGRVPADGNPHQRALTAQVSRFADPELAAGVMPAALSHTGGVRFYGEVAADLPWPGATAGGRWLFRMKTQLPQPDFYAAQVVGSYVVSAEGTSATDCTEGIAAMVSNLRHAGLVA